MRKALILLATYNGSKFLGQLIRSLEAQTVTGWQLWARDDGSDDDTPALLEDWAARDKRVTVLDANRSQAHSAVANFAALMLAALDSDCDTFFLCDQDDIWEPNKIELCLDAIGGAGGGSDRAGSDESPVLAVSDLRVFDSSAPQKSWSFWRSNFMPSPQWRTPGELCSRNLYPGCSMVLNRPLLALASEVPGQAIMHDWWIAILAHAAAEVVEVSEPLVRYRQHQHNDVGATSLAAETRAFLRGDDRNAALFRRSFAQAAAAADRLEQRGCRSSAAQSVRAYAALPGMSVWRALNTLWSLKLRRHNPLLLLLFSLRLLQQRTRPVVQVSSE